MRQLALTLRPDDTDEVLRAAKEHRIELFAQVTDELLTTVGSDVAEVVMPSGEDCKVDPEADAAALITAFEAIRPFGRQWYLLYSDAMARSLRDEELRTQLVHQRSRLRDAIAILLRRGMEMTGERSRLDLEDLAQLVVGVYIDLMVREQLDGRDITELAATTILGTVRAFLEPAESPPEKPKKSRKDLWGIIRKLRRRVRRKNKTIKRLRQKIWRQAKPGLT